MQNDRTSIIIKEIRYWKESRMLPEAYCDYLLALYTQGDGITEVKEESPKGRGTSLQRVIILMINLFLLPLSFLVIYFTEMTYIMQTVILSINVGISFGTFYLLFQSRQYRRDVHIPLIVGLLNLLMLSIYTINHWFSTIWLLGAVHLMNCILWFIIGRKLDLQYLKVGGFIGVLVFIISLVF
ncbi:hypothetical protein [Thalassobacillus hwangdonensis]|uniref:Uncharacterized protein n=1 Tax=Thalassobacillus hwangdonensis TaxID=546108 RepID=A0ABW3L0Z6_9BACI